MPSNAAHKFARVSPRKCRLVADLVRGMDYEVAQAVLRATPAKSAALIAKLLKSAYSNAEVIHLDTNRLFVSKIFVNEAGGLGVQGKLKRFTPRAQGRATPILKRSSHIHVELDERPY